MSKVRALDIFEKTEIYLQLMSTKKEINTLNFYMNKYLCTYTYCNENQM